MKLVSIVGARPQFVKLAPLTRAFEQHAQIQHSIIHTGQHYDDKMSAVFFDELELPKPDLNLDIGSASHAVQTGNMMMRLEEQFLNLKPDAVLVYGDTNSTLAACMAAAKIHLPIAHIEAGLRSFNRKMPEEINRVATDHCSDRLYAPTPTGMSHLRSENLESRAIMTGDVMRDAVMHNIELAHSKSNIVERLELHGKPFAVLTLHRPSNTDTAVLPELIKAINALSADTMPVVFPVHPRTRALLEKTDKQGYSSIRFIEPLAYLDMLSLVQNAAIALTDSGGLQKEAAFLETPCVTLREETEWTETVEMGVNQLVGNDTGLLRDTVNRVVSSSSPFTGQILADMNCFFGTGKAAHVITEDILQFFQAQA